MFHMGATYRIVGSHLGQAANSGAPQGPDSGIVAFAKEIAGVLARILLKKPYPDISKPTV